MPKTLEELRAERRAPVRAERTLSLCLAPDLVAEVSSIIEQMEALPVQAARSTNADGEVEGPPLRMGDTTAPVADPAEAALKARLQEVLDQMAEHDGELRVRAGEDGEWRRWVNAHPARGEDKPAEHQRDREVTLGYCNADDLIEDLGRYAFSWNGDPLTGDDWAALIEPFLTNPDKKAIARAVVSMYEQVSELPKWGRLLSATLRSEPDAGGPAKSVAPPRSTSDESPTSDTSTTRPTGP